MGNTVTVPLNLELRLSCGYQFPAKLAEMMDTGQGIQFLEVK